MKRVRFNKSNKSNKPGQDFAGAVLGITGSTVAKPNPNAKPVQGEATGPQNVAGGANLGFPGIPGLLYQNAGGSPTGLGFGGLFPGSIPGVNLDIGGTFWGWSGSSFVQPRKGSYATYRMMTLDGTLNLVKRMIFAPILASRWTIQPAEGVTVSATGNKFLIDPISGAPKQAPQKAIDFLSDTILPKRRPLLKECLRYIESGWRPFERVYQLRNGGPNQGKFYTLQKMKPLLPEFASILHDGSGNYAGITINTGNTSDGNVGGSLAPNKSWICSNDVEAGNLYGLSRYEHCFDPWVDKQKTRVKKYLLMGKLSGVLPTLYYRPGKTLMGGEYVDNFEIAKQIVAVAFMGGAACIPTTEYSDTDLQENAELAKLAPWKLEIQDAGNYAAAMNGFIAEDEHNEKLLIRGMGWPERAVIEATTAGSRADSESHTANASQDLEAIDMDIAAQVSQGQPEYDVPGVVNELLKLNYGEDAQDAIVVKADPLEDDLVDTYQALLNSWFENPAIGPYLMAVPDIGDVFQHLGIKCGDDVGVKLPDIVAEIVQAANNKNAPKPAPGDFQDGGETDTPPDDEENMSRRGKRNKQKDRVAKFVGGLNGGLNGKRLATRGV